MIDKCPNCGYDLNESTHKKHSAKCADTLCPSCNHCEYSSGPKVERCRCQGCSCYDINFGGDPT